MSHRTRWIPCLMSLLIAVGCAAPAGATPAPPTGVISAATIDLSTPSRSPTDSDPITSTPTPTAPEVSPGPTLPAPPSETPTLTAVPTVQPPTLAAPHSDLPTGWIAYQATVYLDPANVNPSTIACHLHVARIDGSGDRDLTPESHDCVAGPAVSADGRWIAFLSGYGRNMSAGFASSIMVVSVDGSQRRSFNPTPLSLGGLRWSKDGARIAYLFLGDNLWHVIDAESGAAGDTLDALTAGDWLLANLSPDGQYRAAYCAADQQAAGHRVCITSLAADTRPLGRDADGGIGWSPDGQWIGYAVQDALTSGDTANDGTYLMHPDGSGAVRISRQIAAAIWFEASP